MKVCNFDGCDRAYSALGYCSAHYNQLRDGKPLKPLANKRSDSLIQSEVANGVLTCLGCNELVPLENYGKDANAKSGVKGRCKDCRKNETLERRYGLSREAWNRLLESQGGCCALCGTDNPVGTGFVVDHDHNCCPGRETCGMCVRSLLCHKCNATVGFIEAHPDIMNAVEYVQRNHVQLPEKYFDSAANHYGWLRVVGE